jgi:hypothetical protein
VYNLLDTGDFEPTIVCRSLSLATSVEASMGRDTIERAEQWAAVAHAAGDPYEEALALSMLCLGRTGDGPEATNIARTGLGLAISTGSPSAKAFCSFTTALTLLDDDPSQADAFLSDALSYAKVADNDFAYGVALAVRGGLVSRAGDHGRAAEIYLDSARRAHDYGHRLQQAAQLWPVAGSLAALGQLEAAAVIMGWVDAVVDASGFDAGRGTGPGGMVNYFMNVGAVTALDSLADNLGADRYAALAAEGRELRDDDVMRYAAEQVGT